MSGMPVRLSMYLSVIVKDSNVITVLPADMPLCHNQKIIQLVPAQVDQTAVLRVFRHATQGPKVVKMVVFSVQYSERWAVVQVVVLVVIVMRLMATT
jgi:hypothetical protein